MSASALSVGLGIASLLGFPDLDTILNNIPQGNIGGIPIQVTIEEIATDTLEVTDHPVELGAQITDHSFKRPSEIIMRCGWSNSSVGAALGAVESLFSSGSLSGSDFVHSVYSQLIGLQEKRRPFLLVSSMKQYPNMLIRSISLTRDKDTSQALMVTATMREVIIVSTQSATLAPIANQALPASTAEVVNAGPQQLIPSTPALKWLNGGPGS